MWPAFKLNSAMSSASPSVTHGRPWTPPDTDSEYFATDSPASDDLGDSWPDHDLITPHTTHRPKPSSSATDAYYSVKAPRRTDAHAHHDRLDYPSDVESHSPVQAPSISDARLHLDLHRYPSAPALHSPTEATSTHYAHAHGRGSGPLEDPHTPVKALRTPDPHPHDGIPRYPYTPDSARTTRTYPLPAPLSPLPPMPWEPRKASSPMRTALSSCISHLESLIDTRQPNDEQMEYLVTKFEEMAQCLSAPEAQSRQSDDYLFSELEPPSGLGITSAISDEEASNMSIGASYILQVERYIGGVKKHAEDLKARMDEVTQLNSIQLDIIDDLRRTLKEKSLEQKAELDIEEPVPEELEEEEDIPPYPPQRTGFWTAVGEALDAVAETLFEW